MNKFLRSLGFKSLIAVLTVFMLVACSDDGVNNAADGDERKDRDFDYSEDYAYAAYSHWYENGMHVRTEGKSFGSSVRCVKD
ncbi:MAG: hypothetical protein J6W51_10025 [Fibrobacter sp.]|nr:hypothetical protein [Fibrobacter sp.]